MLYVDQKLRVHSFLDDIEAIAIYAEEELKKLSTIQLATAIKRLGRAVHLAGLELSARNPEPPTTIPYDNEQMPF